jgi:hypothetical protein
MGCGPMNPLLLTLAWQAWVGLSSARKRRSLYAEARAYAERVRKPLLVIGGPLGSGAFRRTFNIKAHGYGDVCTDIDPLSCRGANRFIQADITHLPFRDKEFGAVFVSHVLDKLSRDERPLAVVEVAGCG